MLGSPEILRSKVSKVSGNFYLLVWTKAWRSNKKLAQRDAAERAGESQHLTVRLGGLFPSLFFWGHLRLNPFVGGFKKGKGLAKKKKRLKVEDD